MFVRLVVKSVSWEVIWSRVSSSISKNSVWDLTLRLIVRL